MKLQLLTTVVCLGLAAAAVRAETHTYAPTAFARTFSAARSPALRIHSGDHVTTTTAVDDAETPSAPRAADAGPQTGPFYVEDAAPGDLIVVTIESLEPTAGTALAPSVVLANAVDEGALSNKPAPRLPWTIDAARRVVRFDLTATLPSTNWRSRYDPPEIELPLAPALGSLGVAPAEGEVSAASAGAFGGNMQVAGVGPGTKVMFPVFAPGALLYLGRGLARLGDGSITGSGLETPMRVTFSVELVKKKEWPHSSVARPSTVAGEFPIEWPRVETADYVMAIGSGPTLDQALQHATSELHHWLDDDFGFSERSLSAFLGPAIEYQIASIASGHETVVAKVRRSYLPKPLATAGEASDNIAAPAATHARN